MSILIKGLEMPKDGALLCLRIYPSGVVRTCFGPPQPPDSKIATAIPVSDHGDLIDRDALFDDNSWDWFNEWGSTVNKQAQLVVEAPTIIPAERSDGEKL